MLNMQRNTAAKTKIPNKGTRSRNAAIAAITVASLSLPVMSVAQAQGGKEMPAATIELKQHAARYKLYNTVQEPSTTTRRIDGETLRADPAFHHYPTWPEGEPDYHGSNGG
jgi:hypothetical protein